MSSTLSDKTSGRPLQSHGSSDFPKVDLTANRAPQESSLSEPFPSFDNKSAFQYNSSLPALKTNSPPAQSAPNTHSPITGLKLQTEHLVQKNRQRAHSTETASIPESASQTNFNAGLPIRNSSIRSARQPRRGSLSPGSTNSSPAVGPLVDMTPLPSPMSNYGSPGPWRKSSDEGAETPAEPQGKRSSIDSGRPTNFGRISPKKRKIPIIGGTGLDQVTNALGVDEGNQSTMRSVSEYTPEGLQAPKSRNVVVSASGAPVINQQISPSDDRLHREQCLAIQRGLIPSNLPTPPMSSRGSASDESQRPTNLGSAQPSKIPEYEATSIRSGKTKRWQAIRQLGEGQFSKVMLATEEDVSDEMAVDPADIERILDPRSLVAVKICNHGPIRGADEKSLETSIKRELELMKAIDHPSLVHLKAVNMHARQTLFILNYCPGGDLFELASTHIELFQPPLIRRIFAELVCAIQYLHARYIVHRDVKLESRYYSSQPHSRNASLIAIKDILVNIRPEQIRDIQDWQKYDRPVCVLSDLGLGRDIPRPPESPLLRRRCGSEDYAAPEVLIGQDYDGRSTDAWALGVVLYTLIEHRMPFDPVPGSRRKTPISHKIARCEWQWVHYADADGEWDPDTGRDLEAAKDIVEGLIARTRNRWSLDKVQHTEWVSNGIQIPGGLERGRSDL